MMNSLIELPINFEASANCMFISYYLNHFSKKKKGNNISWKTVHTICISMDINELIPVRTSQIIAETISNDVLSWTNWLSFWICSDSCWINLYQFSLMNACVIFQHVQTGIWFLCNLHHSKAKLLMKSEFRQIILHQRKSWRS